MDGLENVAGVEEQNLTESANQDATENPTTTETTETAETITDSEGTVVDDVEPSKSSKSEEDSRFAAVRRKAEESARAKYEAETNSINAEFKRVFGSYNNPLTGKPIESWKDYIDAIEAQNRKAQEDEMKSKGIDPDMFNEYINNSPAIRQANEILKQNQIAEAERQLAADLKTLSEIDPAIKTQADLLSHPSYNDVLKLVQNNNLSLPDAYKLANYQDLSNKHNAAAKQAVINQVKGKNHLETSGTGAAQNSNEVDIPQSEIAQWRTYYPGLSDAELKKKYNQTI